MNPDTPQPSVASPYDDNSNKSTAAWDDIADIMRHADEARSANDERRAYVFYSRATDLTPKNADAWSGRAATTMSVDDAIASWGQAVALVPENQEARHALEKRIDEKVGSSKVEDLASLVRLGKGLAQKGQKPSAYRLLKRATELDDTHEEAWLWRAGLTDDKKEMLAALKRVLALNPDNAQAQSGLKWVLRRQPNTSTQSSSTEQAARLLKEGQQLVQLGDKSQAHALFVRATEIEQKNEQAWLWRSTTTEDLEEALTCVEQALAIDPNNESAREARSWLRVKKIRQNAKGLAPAGRTISPSALPRLSPEQWQKILRVFFILLVVLLFAGLAWFLVVTSN